MTRLIIVSEGKKATSLAEEDRKACVAKVRYYSLCTRVNRLRRVNVVTSLYVTTNYSNCKSVFHFARYPHGYWSVVITSPYHP